MTVRQMLGTSALVAACMFSAGASDSLLTKPDLSKPKKINTPKGDPIRLIVDGKLMLPVVIGPAPRARWGGEFLCDVIGDMTGTTPTVVVESPKLTGPAIYISNLEATKRAGLSADGMKGGEFAVKTKDGSIYLYGNDTTQNSFGSSYAVYDFCERILDARQYFDPKKGGRTVVKTQNLTIPPLDYGDAPQFEKRDLWPYTGRQDLQTWRTADTYPITIMCHEPRQWYQDTDYQKNRPEIFQMEKDGTRTTSPMLCYGHPRTLETYLERIDEELKGGRKAGFIKGTTVTVAPYDGAVACNCEYCKKLFDPAAGSSGSASKILYAFVRKLSDALVKKHPELTVGFMPYLNYCDVPEGASFPAGNVEVQLCSMPGLAMFKEPEVKAHEEALLRAWAKASGRKIENWHYICWPAEFTNAPYIYADTISRHYRDMQDVTVGSFINGWFNPEERHFLSAYVWLRVLWDVNVDSQAILDEFARRMFGPAEKSMHELIHMQQDGWNRHWKIANLSPKNIYGISYPREDALKMEALLAKAYTLAGDDAQITMRLDFYKKGLEAFFKESKEYAEGTAFEPLMMQKVGANPTIDGKLDEADWKQARPLPFVRALDRKQPTATYPTTVQAVWTPQGVTFGFRMTEPMPDKLYDKDPAGVGESWGNDNVELYLDVSGKGEGDYIQIIFDTRFKEGMMMRRSIQKDPWTPKGIEAAIFRGKDFWSSEIYIPYTAFADFPDAQIPSTMAEGRFWLGNFTRHRVADTRAPGTAKDSVAEMQRLNTRYSAWNCDQSAFGQLKFKE